MIASFLIHTLLTVGIWLSLFLGFWKWIDLEVSPRQLGKRLLVHVVVFLVSWPATVVSTFALMKHRGTWTVIFEGEWSAQQTFFSLLVFYSGSVLTHVFLFLFDYEQWKAEAEEKDSE